VVLILSAYGIYLYVEEYVDIPNHWVDHAKQICRTNKLRNSYMLHYNTVSGMGTTGFIITFYAIKAYRSYIGDPVHFTHQEGEEERQRYPAVEILFRLVAAFLIDELLGSQLTYILFG
jgi:hypothetical protein